MSPYPCIWFLRHGETEWNAERRIQGQLESVLTAKGRAQAAQQSTLLSSILETSPDVFVSPLGRAQQTAKIALNGHRFQTDARLAEAHAGDWQGLLHAEVRRDFANIVTPDMSSLEMFLSAPGGEGFEAFEARILAFLNDLTRPSVVIAHGLLGQVLRGLVRGLDKAQMGHLTNQQGCIYLLEDGQEEILSL